MRFLFLLGRATTLADRWMMGLSGLGIVLLGVFMSAAPGRQATVFRDNRPVLTLPLDRDVTQEVAGRLGPVMVEVRQGQIRLLEYNSPKMLGTRTGWIQGAGRMTACVPCGILVRVEGSGKQSGSEYDGVAQ